MLSSVYTIAPTYWDSCRSLQLLNAITIGIVFLAANQIYD